MGNNKCGGCRLFPAIFGFVIGIAFLALFLAGTIPTTVLSSVFAVGAIAGVVLLVLALPFFAYLPENSHCTGSCICRGAICTIIALLVAFVAGIVGFLVIGAGTTVLSIILFFVTGALSYTLVSIVETVVCLITNNYD